MLYSENSSHWRLTTAYLKHIAQSLELPTAGSADETRQLIEGKLQETRDVANVQVVVDETATTVKLSVFSMKLCPWTGLLKSLSRKRTC